MNTTMADFMKEEATRLIAEANTPEALAEEALADERRKVRLEDEFYLGVRLGWWDEDGNSLNEEQEDEDE